MLLATLGLAIVLGTGSTAGAEAWLPPQIAEIEAFQETATLRIAREPATIPMPLAPGLTSRRVSRLQQHLAELGVFRGEIDGVYGRETAAAVVTVHKLAGIDRSDVWQPTDWDIRLEHGAILTRHPDELDRLEVDLNRQVLFVIRAGEIAAILPVSSGNGEVYWSKNGGPEGGYVRATTPQGDFHLFKHIDGWRKNYLGSLYKPWYFTPYYAVHGSSSVPAHPASHGCVRVPTWESDHLDGMLEIGLPVHIWDEVLPANPGLPGPATGPHSPRFANTVI